RVAPDLGDVPASQQRAQYRLDVDAADGGDLRTGDGLLVGDDRQRLERGRGQPCVLALEDEPLDVGGQVGVRLVPVPTGHLDQHEAAPPLVVLVGELTAERFDGRARELEELCEESGVDRVRGRHDHRLDHTPGFVCAQALGRVLERVVVHGYSVSEGTV